MPTNPYLGAGGISMTVESWEASLTRLPAVARREIVDPDFAHQISALSVGDVQNHR